MRRANSVVSLIWTSTLVRTQLITSAFHIRGPYIVNLIYVRSAIANQESLSGLETEMRKLEGLVKEVVDEMNYLKKREERFTNTNCTPKHVYPFQLISDT